MKNDSHRNETLDFYNKYLNQPTDRFSLAGTEKCDFFPLHALESPVLFEAPDLYYFDSKTSVLYLFEHFEFDASVNTCKGSDERIARAADKREFSRFVPEDSLAVYKGQIQTKVSVDSLLTNIFSAFDRHYEKINSYKMNVRKKLNLPDDVKIIITFILEDRSTFEVSYHDENGIVSFCPLGCKEVLEFLTTKNNVDFVISASEGNRNVRTMFILSLTRITIQLEKAFTISDKELVEFNPQSIGMKLPL